MARTHGVHAGKTQLLTAPAAPFHVPIGIDVMVPIFYVYVAMIILLYVCLRAHINLHQLQPKSCTNLMLQDRYL